MNLLSNYWFKNPVQNGGVKGLSTLSHRWNALDSTKRKISSERLQGEQTVYSSKQPRPTSKYSENIVRQTMNKAVILNHDTNHIFHTNDLMI